jgi:hypothetical protein
MHRICVVIKVRLVLRLLCNPRCRTQRQGSRFAAVPRPCTIVQKRVWDPTSRDKHQLARDSAVTNLGKRATCVRERKGLHHSRV